MTTEQSKHLDKIYKMQENLTDTWIDYWQLYSNMGTWQFWFYLALLVIPLILLYVYIDRERALHIGFYGFNIHVWFTYIDALGIRNALWSYPYHAIPPLIGGFALDVSLVPVLFMLVYQWTIRHDKNYYLYAGTLSLVLAFLFKPALVAFGLFELNKWANFFHLFLGYFIVMLISKWITALFVRFERGTEPEPASKRKLTLHRMFRARERAK